MKRSDKEKALMRKRRRLAIDRLGLSAEDCPPNRFRKRHPFDCGKAGCQLCHGEKVHGIKSHRERKADIAFAQGLSDADFVRNESD